MNDPILIRLQERNGTALADLWLDGNSTLASLRERLSAEGAMAPDDIFDTGELPEKDGAVRWSRVDRAAEDVRLTDGALVRVRGPRVAITLADRNGVKQSLFVLPGATLATLRATNPIVTDDDRFAVNGAVVDRANEAAKSLTGVTAVSLVSPEFKAPERPPFRLLILAPGRDPTPFDWQDGSVSGTLKDLRTALGDKAGRGPFVVNGKPVAGEMEPFETVKLLGKPEDGERLRVTFGSALSPPATGAARANAAPSPAAVDDDRGGNRGAANPLDRLSFRSTRDLLSLLGTGPATGGPPADTWESLDESLQGELLLALRHLHGLRFVSAGVDERERSFQLDRSIRQALLPIPGEPAVSVVRPLTTTRYSASASETRTAENIRSMLSWNVGGSLGGTSGDDSISLSSNYTERKTSGTAGETAALSIRVDYLVARAEIIVDPQRVTLPPDMVGRIRELTSLDRNAEQARIRIHLAEILDGYGAYVALRTLVGGKMTYRQVRSLQALENRDELVRSLKADAEAKVRGIKATATGGETDETGKQTASERASHTFEVTISGGDPALAALPYQWADSLDHQGWWSVIAFADVRPIFAFLPSREAFWVASTLANDPAIADQLDAPLDWRRYAAQVQDAAARLARRLPSPADAPVPADEKGKPGKSGPSYRQPVMNTE